MRASFRQVVSLAAIYAVALHAILLGVVPVFAGTSVASDPFSIICHSDAHGSAGRTGPRQARYSSRPSLRPLQSLQRLGCAGTSIPYWSGHLAPTRLLQVLQPISTRHAATSQ